jgi:hypothetical protein
MRHGSHVDDLILYRTLIGIIQHSGFYVLRGFASSCAINGIDLTRGHEATKGAIDGPFSGLVVLPKMGNTARRLERPFFKGVIKSTNLVIKTTEHQFIRCLGQIDVRLQMDVFRCTRGRERYQFRLVNLCKL